MDIQEIIAAIDAEVARLQHARFLIAQSCVNERAGYQRLRQPAAAKRRKGKAFTRDRETPARSRDARWTERKEEALVAVIRVPAREAPRPRLTRAAAKQTKQSTALTSDVPKGPVAAPRKAGQKAEGLEGTMTRPTSVPASAFGIAISRGLASLEP